MLPFIALVFLLIHEGSGQQNPVLLNFYVTKKINYFRESIANGTAYKLGGHLPSTKSMFQLNFQSKYMTDAMLVIHNCSENLALLTPGASINTFSLSNLPFPLNETNVADIALAVWEEEPIMYGIGNDVTYTDTKLVHFANMVYYKSTQFGCAYQQCNSTSTMPATQTFACVFNNAPQLNEPLYVASKTGAVIGCTADSDCSPYLSSATCVTAVTQSTPYKGLCSANGATFPTSTNVTMSTTPAMTTSTTSSARVSTTTATTNSSSDPITDAIREKIIDMHNYRRSRLAQGLVPNGMTGKNCAQGMNLYSMIYDTDLENEAQQYANSCPLSGSSPESRTSGENFAAIPSSSATTYYDAVYQAIKEFWREIKVNADGVNEAMVFTDVLRYKTLAPLRFTQMAWANTYQVGCGARQCGENTVVVCRYNPRGNIVGENIYDVGPTCGECFDICTTAYLYKGLCPAP